MKELETILKDQYGVTIITATPNAILWAVERITLASQARKELKAANRLRERSGVCVAYAPYGHHAY